MADHPEDRLRALLDARATIALRLALVNNAEALLDIVALVRYAAAVEPCCADADGSPNVPNCGGPWHDVDEAIARLDEADRGE